MRILQVRFKNLNSLYGEWCIDFTDPAFDGIFAITGPTGAGKTTILDALCLGLYGRTPRLALITRSGNELMSRRTGECFAEVSFTVATGSYRCHWSQHRARKTAAGELQQARHEVVEAGTGRVLESRKQEVAGVVERLTGMDFDRFTRSMLLAQGGFAAFLQADADQRAPILEQVTGTAIYSRISRQVHECTRAEADKLEGMQGALAGIRLLSAEEREELASAVAGNKTREGELAEQLRQCEAALHRQETLAALAREIEQLHGELQQAESERKAFAPEEQRLELAQAAAVLDPEHQALVGLRRSQTADGEALQRLEQSLPELVKTERTRQAEADRAAEQVRVVRRQQEEEIKLFATVRLLDQQLLERQRGVEALEARCAAAQTRQDEHAGRVRDLEQQLAGRQRRLADAGAYLEANRSDAALPAALDGLRQLAAGGAALTERRSRVAASLAEQRSRLAQAQKEALALLRQLTGQDEALQRSREVLSAETHRLEELLAGREQPSWHRELEEIATRTLRCAELQHVAAEAEDARQRQERLAGRIEAARVRQSGLLEALQAREAACQAAEREVGHLEVQHVLQQRILGLEAERRRLEDGSPCPLCGALEHPYAAGNLPEPGEVEPALEAARKVLADEIARREALGRQVAAVESALQQEEEQMAEARAAVARWTARQSGILAALDMAEASGQDAAHRALELEALGRRQEELRRRVAQIDGLVQQVQAAERGIAGSERRVGELRQEHRDAEYHAKGVEQEIVRLEAELRRIGEEEALALQQMRARLGVFDVSLDALARSGEVLGQLEQRSMRWEVQQQTVWTLEKEAARLEAEALRGRDRVQEGEKSLVSLAAERSGAAAMLADLQHRRMELFGDRNPDAEEQHLAARVRDSDRTLREATAALESARAELRREEARQAALQQAYARRGEELRTAEERFAALCRRRGFADEAAFLAALLDEETRQRLQSEAKRLVGRCSELEVRHRERTGRYAQALADGTKERRREEVVQERDAAAAALRQLALDIGALRQRLNEADRAQQEHEEQLRRLSMQQKELERWQRLHALIGSADGKKFRNFAQGLTFEAVIGHANAQLAGMTDRYLLIRDEAGFLDLNVIDSYQAGEIRSTRNLSGGESFLVSLALALGLSSMSSRLVRVDSLFLDEGFGTLDDDALETALETLAGLQQQGKLIGVISHVPALRERITTQVEVVPSGGGRSRLVGPGCSRVAT